MAKRKQLVKSRPTGGGSSMKRGRRPKRLLQRQPITVEDLAAFHIVSRPQISPDGGRIVFVERHVGEKNDYASNLWLVDTAGGELRQFTSGDRDSAPRWSPDGSRIAFVRAKEKTRPQIYVIGAAAGEATALTQFPEGSIGDFRWSPDGSMLAVSFRRQDPARTTEAKKAREEKGLSDPPWEIDDIWYRLDGDGYFGQRRHQLYLVDAATGEHRRIYGKDTLGTFTFDFSPDSQQLVVSTNRDRRALIRPWKDELLRIDVQSGRVTPIPKLPAGPKSCVRWSPDGKTIAYAGRTGEDGLYSVENLELYVCHPTRGRARSLTANTDYCLLAVNVTDTAEAVFEPSLDFSPDGRRVFFRLGIEGETHVASVPTGGGPVSIHTQGALEHELGNVSADGTKVALTVSDPTRPAEVAVADVSDDRFEVGTLTDLNGPLFAQREAARPESHWITAENGHKIHVWVLRPPADRAGRNMPAVLEIHGGPHAQYGSGFFHELQVLAAEGYVVFYSNPRGSKGYGRDHCAAIRGSWGGADWSDLRAVIQFMKDQPDVDETRIGVMGGSYGGYMTNWAVGHCDDFAAAITDRCVSNLVSMSGTTDFVDEPDRYFPGNFWDRPEARWEQSPIHYFGNVKTPMLIIHSEGDLRCNIEQAEQVYAALKLRDVPARFVRYPASTSHGMSRKGPPDLRMHRLREILAWWAKHLQ